MVRLWRYTLGVLTLILGAGAVFCEFSAEPTLEWDSSIEASEPRSVKPSMPPDSALTKKSVTLQGSVITIDDAIRAEAKTVDWYSWYLACRQHIISKGGIACPLGTPIYIYRSGIMKAKSPYPRCVASLQNKRFPFPDESKLPVIILPVRDHRLPPASPHELNSRIKDVD